VTSHPAFVAISSQTASGGHRGRSRGGSAVSLSAVMVGQAAMGTALVAARSAADLLTTGREAAARRASDLADASNFLLSPTVPLMPSRRSSSPRMGSANRSPRGSRKSSSSAPFNEESQV